MQGSQRLDYDAIAKLYDTHPYRAKDAAPELALFLADRGSLGGLALLDIACGTGNQLIANYSTVPEARIVGIDHSLGMLRQARRKAPAIGWVRADAASVPLAGSSFDYISRQFAFHHFRDKPGMVGEAFRLRRPGGRLVLHNLCPEECPDWLTDISPKRGRSTSGISGPWTRSSRQWMRSALRPWSPSGSMCTAIGTWSNGSRPCGCAGPARNY